ncbi:MAG: ABC transporter ATP-binding protein [Clostridiales bacterium]|nr:ABC transporter ATP-binding protein [Clostridiales bacterium]
MKQLLNAITCNHPQRIIKPVIWNTLASLSNLLPFLCLVYIVQEIYMYFITGQLNPNSLWMAWGGMVVFFILTWRLENMACKATYRDGFRLSAEGRIKLAEHIRKLPMGVLMRKNSGEIGNTMMTDFSRTESAVTHILPQMISGVMTAVIASTLLIIADWRMGLAIFAGFPIALSITFGMNRLERRLESKLNATKIEQTNQLQEYLYGMRMIKSYHMQGENFGKLEKACMNYRDACIQIESRIGPVNLVAAAILESGLSLMTVVGVFLAVGGTLTVPDFALFLLVGTRIFDPLTVALMNYSELMLCHLSGNRICQLLNEPTMTGDYKPSDTPDIKFNHVSFKYDDRDILHDINIHLKPDTMTALVGPSGSGKSTILRLIARFYDPDSGKVLFGNEDERKLDPEELMKKISMVFQEVYLFQDTIANNIGYGKENATREEIETAAKAANCYDFINQLPQGFDTMIGEGGATLSGGEKQRLSIARALLKNAPVVLLDEATSSLDPENEAEIQQAIGRLIKGRTVVIIAHRLKTIVGADSILVLENGHIVEEGTHQQLLKQNGLYSRLWHLQMATEDWKIA